MAAVPGAIGVMFLDYEGETVEMLGERPFELSDDDLRIIGAYQGIFLTQLRDLCVQLQAGGLRRFKLDFATARVFTFALTDGYYVVFVTESASNEAMVWRQLFKCRERLLAAM